MKKIICLFCIFFLLFSLADARFPQKGDHVQVLTNSGKINVHVYEGNITDIRDGLLCMNCTSATTQYVGEHSSGMDDISGMWYMDFYTPCDVCIGVGQIIALVWPDDQNMLRYLEQR